MKAKNHNFRGDSSPVNIKSLGKNILRVFGFDVRLIKNIRAHQHRTWEEKWAAKCRFLQRHNIKTVIDIGANVGQFSSLIHRVLPEARICAFEPLKDCFNELQRALKSIPGAKSLNMALGDFTGLGEINRSEFSPSSSLLKMTDFHKQEWPHSARHTREQIQIACLDDVMIDEDVEPEILIKVDVQGYEASVIRGGRSIVSKARFVIVETSFWEFYYGQPLFDDLYQLMIAMGFIYRGSIDQFASDIDGRPLFADAIFENINATELKSNKCKFLGREQRGRAND